MSSTNYCDKCHSLARWLCSDHVKQHFPDTFVLADGSTMLTTSVDCQFCNTLVNWFQNYVAVEEVPRFSVTVTKDRDKFVSHVIVKNDNVEHQRVIPQWTADGLCLNPPGRKREIRIEFDVWTDQVSAQGSLSTRPPIVRYGESDTTRVIQNWIEICCATHPGCRKALTGEEINEDLRTIPADRILDVGTRHGDPIKIVKTNGLTKKYCALSHCWGPPALRPSCVTSKNEARFFQGIPAGELPKTFQDAVQLTRLLSIRYLWIDSLCIIQDSKEHWRQESAKMGSIYEGAYLRISAAGAHNSTEGLFRNQVSGELWQTVRVPIIEGDKRGHVKFRSSKDGSKDPARGPLETRSWVFQESRLARRTVSFMPTHMTWTCRHESRGVLDERNVWHNSFRGKDWCGNGLEWSEWEQYVTAYSYRHLTYESDRLIAIEGLAREMAKNRSDRFLLGMWTADLPRQLIWQNYVAGKGMLGNPKLPSWTWAHHPGIKQFPYYCGGTFPKLAAPEQQRLFSTLSSFNEDTGTLSLRGSILTCVLGRRMDGCCHDQTLGIISAESQLFSTTGSMIYKVTAPGASKDSMMDLAQLDGAKHYDTHICAIMVVGERPRGEWLSPENQHDPASNQALPVYDTVPGRARECLDDYYSMIKYGTGEVFYWALFLEPTGEDDTFRRIGIGILWPCKSIDNHPPEQTFHLV